jgi:hypothetical protein
LEWVRVPPIIHPPIIHLPHNPHLPPTPQPPITHMAGLGWGWAATHHHPPTPFICPQPPIIHPLHNHPSPAWVRWVGVG